MSGNVTQLRKSLLFGVLGIYYYSLRSIPSIITQSCGECSLLFLSFLRGYLVLFIRGQQYRISYEDVTEAPVFPHSHHQSSLLLCHSDNLTSWQSPENPPRLMCLALQRRSIWLRETPYALRTSTLPPTTTVQY